MALDLEQRFARAMKKGEKQDNAKHKALEKKKGKRDTDSRHKAFIESQGVKEKAGHWSIMR